MRGKPEKSLLCVFAQILLKAQFEEWCSWKSILVKCGEGNTCFPKICFKNSSTLVYERLLDSGDWVET